jgi:ribosome biogenesis protein Nip4
MGDQYTFYRVDKKGNITPQVRNIRMLLEHNTMTVGGKKVISLSDIETKTGVKVSDLISQLMNGWVDVAKDAWVFNINGNNIAGPVLLFMLEAGVDYETAVYLTTQPLVVDYVKEVYKQMSPFNTQESEEPIKITMGLAKYKAKVNMLKKFGYFDNGFNPKSTDLYKTILELAGNKQFTLEQLKNSVVTKDKTSDVARAAFAHFLELEETAKTLTNAKLKVNVDTAPSKSIVAAKKRLLDIAELSDYEAMPLVNKIFTDSPIKSFLIQGLQIKLFSPLMPLRFNDVVTDNIIKYIKDGNLIRTKFNGDIDRFSDSYKNDLVAYIFQNVIKGINFKKLTEYKGLNIKPLTVKNVLLKAGAFVKDGNLYLDLDQLKHDFETNAFAGQDVEGRPSSYKELGLHTLPAVYFKSIGNKDQQFQEYVKFVIEREILRSITKGSEEDLAKRALERSFNFYHNYKSKDSIANQLFTLKEDYAKGFVSEYSAFFDNILNKKKTKGDFQQLGLRTNKADSNLTNAIVENLIRLADPSTKKVSDVAENNRISRFFNRLIVSEVLRSGLTKTSTTIISVIPNDVIANILSSYTKEFVSMLKENPDLINSYNNLFAINAGVEFKNYVNYNSAKPNTNKLDEYLSSVENSELLSLINYANLKETLNNNQDKLFLFGNNANGITESKETGVFQSASNTLAVPLKQKGGVSKTALWTDATYESNIQAINDALDAAEVQKQNGATLVIPSNGLNMIDGVNILVNAPKTYEYLVGELYKRFNFVTPGAETNLGFRTIVQENQDITDAEVNDILNKKFEESKKCNQ